MAGRGGLLLKAGAALLAIGSAARAQYATSIPFAPYSGPNRAFSYPTVTNPSLPNQARLQAFGPSMGGSTTLDLPAAPDLFSVDPYGTMNRPTGSRFVPYHAALRTPNRFDQRYTRQDQEFAENQARRDELYFQLRSEQDPKRRAELAEELGRVNEALRRAGAAGRRSAARPGAASTPGPAPSRRTSRGTPLAVPPAALGVGGPAAGTAPSSPPTAGAVERSATGAGAARSSGTDLDPDEVLERSRRLDAASGMARPPAAGEMRPTTPATAPVAAPAGDGRPEAARGLGDGAGDAFGGRGGPGAFGGPADAFRDAPRPGMSRVRRPGTRAPGR
jgi:hypothetical protein